MIYRVDALGRCLSTVKGAQTTVGTCKVVWFENTLKIMGWTNNGVDKYYIICQIMAVVSESTVLYHVYFVKVCTVTGQQSR